MIIAVKIDIKKLDERKFFAGQNGALYADIVLLENRDGEDRYGNHFMAVQSATKEEREAGKRGAICGNAKIIGGQPRSRKQESSRPSKPPIPTEDNSDIPF